MRIATTESISVCAQNEKLTAFIELEWVIGLTPKSGRWTMPPFAEESEIENSS